jgi:hypothetical protein
LFDGIELHPDVISIHISILLYYQSSQLSLIGWCWLQPLEPLLGSTSQIQLGNLKEFIYILISHFSCHGEPFCLVIDVLMVSPPEQFIHSLGTGHLANVPLQTRIATLPTTHGSLDHNQVTTNLSSFAVYSVCI